MEFKKTKESGIVVKVKKEKRYNCVECCSYFTGELCDSLRKAFKIAICDSLRKAFKIAICDSLRKALKIAICDSTIFEQIETAYYKQKRF